MDIVDININYSYQAADLTPDITFSLTVQEEYGITWNTDFSNLNSFKRSITSTFLASYCKVYFF